MAGVEAALFEREPVLAKVRAGVYGWLAGATLGAPRRGKKGWADLTFYTPVPDGMAQTFGVDLGALYLRALTDGSLSSPVGINSLNTPRVEGVKSVEGVEIGRLWTGGGVDGPEACRFARENLRRGLLPPLSGAFQNPFAEDASAIGRAPFWGLAFAGRPARAAAWAWHDAAIDHTGPGVWAACFWASAVAAAPFEESVAGCLAAGEAVLPKESTLRLVAQAVLQMHSAGKEWHEARERVLAVSHAHPEEAAAAHGFAIIGCVYGEGDFARTACIAAGCGGAATEAAGAAAALVAAGVGDLPDDWRKPLGEALAVGDAGGAQAPATIQEFADGVVVLFQSNAEGASFRLVEELTPPVPVQEPAEGEGGTEPAAQPEAPEPDLGFLRDPAEIEALHRRSMEEGRTSLGRLWASHSYPKGPTAIPGRTVPVVFRVGNPTDAPIEVSPKIRGPEGWETAHRAKRVRIEPGADAAFAAVTKPPEDEELTASELVMKVEAGELRAPLLPPQVWWTIGPFPNREQMGYDRAYAPEKEHDPDAAFNGRSDLLVRWVRRFYSGCIFDLEPLFEVGPGVVYLTTEVFFDKPGDYQLVLASPVGQIVWIDGEKRSWYQDTHRPFPKAAAPYVTDFQTEGWTRFFIKSLRNEYPISPTFLYFLAPDGGLLYPERFRQPGRAEEPAG
ncbi:MAG: ADP-ribosylglycohydrolase family protein [Armatimonadetes bacterium]|nr:ADP-ribosylglycohydrolase family protein [Armatimonadota bacterium]